MALICDTGPLYAALDSRETDHQACAQLLADAREPVVIPAPVLVEVDYLAAQRLGQGPFAELVRDVEEGAIRIVDLAGSDYTRVRELMEQYVDLRLGFVDAAVVAVVERLGERKLATLDHRHFATVRPRHVSALELLPA